MKCKKVLLVVMCLALLCSLLCSCGPKEPLEGSESTTTTTTTIAADDPSEGEETDDPSEGEETDEPSEGEETDETEEDADQTTEVEGSTTQADGTTTKVDGTTTKTDDTTTKADGTTKKTTTKKGDKTTVDKTTQKTTAEKTTTQKTTTEKTTTTKKTTTKKSNKTTADKTTTKTTVEKTTTTKKTTTKKGDKTTAEKTTTTQEQTTVTQGTTTGKPSTGSIPEQFTNLNLKKKTLKVLLWYEPQPWEQAIYDQFEEMTGCTVKFVSLGTSTMSKKLTAMIAANSAPDMVPLDENDFIPCVYSHLVQPITQFVDKKDSWIDWEIADASKYADEYYGVTSKMWGDNVFVYFNKSLFKKSVSVSKTPLDYYNEGNWTWDTFAELAEKMTKKDPNGVVTQLGCYSGLYGAFAQSAGGSIVSYDNGKFSNTLTNSVVKKAAEFEKNLLEKGYLNFNTNTWNQGTTAMFIYPQYMMRVPENYERSFEWDWVPFPTYTGGTSYQPINVQMGCIPTKAKNAEAAYALINWRCYATTNMTTLSESTPKNYVERWEKAMSGKTCFTMDAAVLGSQRFTIYQQLSKENSDVQSTIDSIVPQVNSAIATLEANMESFKK